MSALAFHSRTYSSEYGGKVSKAVRDTIEASVEAQDFSSLIQFLFCGQNDTWPLDQLAENKRVVLETLEDLSFEWTQGVEDMCRANAQDIAHAVKDALLNTKTLKSLRSEVMKVTSNFLDVGKKLQDSMQAIKQSNESQINQQEFKKKGQQLLRQMLRLMHALNLFGEGQYLKVLSLLDAMDEEQKKSDIEPLQFVNDIVNSIKQRIELEGRAQLKDWLANARTGSSEVGQRAIRQAINVRGDEEEQSNRRAKIIEQLLAGARPQTVAKNVANPFKQTSQNEPNGAASNGAQSCLFQNFNLKGVVDIGQVQLAFKVLERLGKLQEGLMYYEESRKQQLVTDLVPPQDFLAHHQAYLLKIVGFFVIEREVNQCVDELSTKTLLWQTAITGLRRSLDETLERVNSAPAMLLIKDFIRLCCRAWEQTAECSTSNVSSVLLDSLHRYESLSQESFISEFKQAVKQDSMSRLQINDKRTCQSMLVSVGLPFSIDNSVSNLEPPFYAPFTSLVPKTVRLLKQNQGDIAAYLEGLATPSEIVSAIKSGNNALVTKNIVPIIQSCVGDMQKNSNKGMMSIMQMASNVSCLKYATSFLEKRAMETCGQAVWVVQTQASEMEEQFKKLEWWCEDQVLAVVVERVEEMFEKMFALNWTPDAPYTKGASQPIEFVISFLHEVQEQMQATLSLGADNRLMQSAIKSAANWLLWVLNDHRISKFNLFAVQRLKIDVKSLRLFAESLKLEAQVEAPMQLVELLLSQEPFQVVDERVRTEKYPHLDPIQISSVMEKIVDISGQSFTLNRGGCRSFTLRRDYVHIAHQLKEITMSE